MNTMAPGRDCTTEPACFQATKIGAGPAAFFFVAVICYSMGMKLKVLGSGQDAGVPHIGCYCPVCNRARKNKRYRRLGPSVAVYDTEAGFCYVIDASPDLKDQVDMLRDEIPRVTRAGRIPVSGILLTHAHFGHCAGLWQLVQEALGEAGLPVFCTAGMREFLLGTPPFVDLVERGNIDLRQVEPGGKFTLGGFICVPLRVPHRTRFSDTVGYIVKAEKSVIYIPDTDAWTDAVIEEMAGCDIALIDGTFYSGDELPRFSEVPHPPIRESVCKLKDLDTAIYFTHINHTNVLNVRGPERKEVERKGFTIAYDGLTLAI